MGRESKYCSIGRIAFVGMVIRNLTSTSLVYVRRCMMCGSNREQIEQEAKEYFDKVAKEMGYD